VPPGDQASTFDKILGFDRHLKNVGDIKVVVAAPSSENPDALAAAGDIRAAFAGLGLDVSLVELADLSGALGPDAVVYVLSRDLARVALRPAQDAKSLTLTGDASLVEAGLVSVGVEPRGERAGIVINPDRLAEEGHAFSADLLKLARIVRGTAAIPVAQVGDAGVVPPRLVGFRAPEYPEMARRQRVEGTVVVRVLVSEAGQAKEVELVEGLERDAGLNEAALRAARTARFEAGTRDGVPVEVWTVINVPFRL
jgi:TonB family protein